MKLYYHKTDGGAEYLTDKYIKWSHNGKSGKEGIVKGAKYIVRIDGDITKDAELSVRHEPIINKSIQWMECLLADITAGNVYYEPQYVEELKRDIKEFKKSKI